MYLCCRYQARVTIFFAGLFQRTHEDCWKYPVGTKAAGPVSIKPSQVITFVCFECNRIVIIVTTENILLIVFPSLFLNALNGCSFIFILASIQMKSACRTCIMLREENRGKRKKGGSHHTS